MLINGTLFTTIPVQIKRKNQALIENTEKTPISIWSSSSFSDDLPEVAKLYLISQGEKNMRDKQGNPISADEIPPTASTISTRGSRGMRTKSQAQFARAILSSWKREKGSQEMKAKKLLPRKGNVSQILDEFLDMQIMSYFSLWWAAKMHLTYRNAFHFIPSRLSSISRLSSHLEDPISPRAFHPIESISSHHCASCLTKSIPTQHVHSIPPRASHPTKYFLSPLILVHVQHLRAFPNPSQTWPHFFIFFKIQL